ncbi:alpha/beta-hydrolase [Thozetella sp. PMI_491]|nr:alpha/beta-hydrolase [Thozetella sp. PMI_491]
MPTFTSPVDSAVLFYRYYVPDETAFRPGSADTSSLTLVFLHGWPMSSRMYEHLFAPLCETHRYRIVAPDRRGFGRSEWNTPSTKVSISYDVFVADLLGLLESLRIGKFVFVTASMGGGESVLAYLASPFVQERCEGFVWLGASMPYPLQTPAHPLSPSRELWDSIMDGLRADRAAYVHEALPGIFAIQAGNVVSTKTLEEYERIVSAADAVALEKTAIIIMRPLEDEVKKLATVGRVPILIVHGDSDQGMPKEASADCLKEMLPSAELKVYEKAGHGLYLTHAEQLLDDLLNFVRSIEARHVREGNVTPTN